jgi:hypothetical protein
VADSFVATGAGNRNQLCRRSPIGELIKRMILAAGRKTRLDMFTEVTNKPLPKLANQKTR